MKSRILGLLVVAGLWVGQSATAVPPETVTVPNEKKYATFDIPAGGASLELHVKGDSTTVDVYIQTPTIAGQDSSDTFQWIQVNPPTGPCTCIPGLYKEYVYQIGGVFSSREWVHVHGFNRLCPTSPCDGAGGVGDPPWVGEFDGLVAAVDLDVDGVLEDVEDTTGGFVSLGGNRQKLTLRRPKPQDSFTSGTVILTVTPAAAVTGPTPKLKLWTAAVGGSSLTFDAGGQLSLPISSMTDSTNPGDPAELGKIFWAEGLAIVTVELTATFTIPGTSETAKDKAKLEVIKPDLDIRESAQPQNRVGRDDPRQDALTRNRILIWADDAADHISFDLIKPPNITGPVWVQIEDQTGLNPAMPHFERLDVASKKFTYLVAGDSDNSDLLVRFGKDLDSNGNLSGADEILGTYYVYGVTREEYAESRNNYNIPPPGYFLWLLKMADELHTRFANGAFTAGDPYVPDTVAGTAILDATKDSRYTHHFGAVFTDNGFVDAAGGRKYYRANVSLSIYHYNNTSAGAVLIRDSDELKAGLNAFVAGLTHAAIAAIHHNFNRTT